MKKLYVAGQNELTREWIPVAELCQVPDGYELRYTNGAQRLPGFAGLGRMQSLDKTYYSRTLFPFFSNRLLSKSRPEYKSYLRWLGFDEFEGDAMDVLSITSGIRATDAYELVAPPRVLGSSWELNFFPRGLRYLSPKIVEMLAELKEEDTIYIMKDVQNSQDAAALALRTESPTPIFIGYVPRYYSRGISRILDNREAVLKASIRRVNPDAPLDMKLLVKLQWTSPTNFEIFQDVEDFMPLFAEHAERVSADVLLRTDLNV